MLLMLLQTSHKKSDPACIMQENVVHLLLTFGQFVLHSSSALKMKRGPHKHVAKVLLVVSRRH